MYFVILYLKTLNEILLIKFKDVFIHENEVSKEEVADTNFTVTITDLKYVL